MTSVMTTIGLVFLFAVFTIILFMLCAYCLISIALHDIKRTLRKSAQECVEELEKRNSAPEHQKEPEPKPEPEPEPKPEPQQIKNSDVEVEALKQEMASRAEDYIEKLKDIRSKSEDTLRIADAVIDQLQTRVALAENTMRVLGKALHVCANNIDTSNKDSVALLQEVIVPAMQELTKYAMKYPIPDQEPAKDENGH